MVTQLTWNSFLLVIIIIASVITPSKQVINKNLDNVAIEQQDPGLEQNEAIPHRIHRVFDSDAQVISRAASKHNITYHFSSGHGGSVKIGPTKVYIIYYGNWTSNQTNIIYTFISNIGNTSWFNIEKTYYYQATKTSPKQYIAGPLTVGGTFSVGYLFGTHLTDTNIQKTLSSYIKNGKFPNDPNGIYLWLTSADVSETWSGQTFITDYCGYHASIYIGNIDYAYGFIGDPGRYLGQGCDPSWINKNISPNGDRGVDGMISLIAHELAEAISDPLVNAWYDSNQEEDADKCAWNFGTLSKLPNGASYNINVGGRYYLIQQLWNEKLQQCAQTA